MANIQPAVADDSRNDLLPDVPTTAESGFPDLQAAFWACVAAPAGTPETIVNRLNQLTNRVLQSPEIEANLAKLGAKQRSGSPQDLAVLWDSETRKWGKIISLLESKLIDGRPQQHERLSPDFRNWHEADVRRSPLARPLSRAKRTTFAQREFFRF